MAAAIDFHLIQVKEKLRGPNENRCLEISSAKFPFYALVESSLKQEAFSGCALSYAV